MWKILVLFVVLVVAVQDTEGYRYHHHYVHHFRHGRWHHHGHHGWHHHHHHRHHHHGRSLDEDEQKFYENLAENVGNKIE
ncbi:histidine-rich protein-like [Crassostrea angulata]|uniref:histidine-rich protein-like n=1 Tax=Magallana angulata TaxID=2784310 RepID=UPI0022B1307F|nr:histidine-rich protein-like [Crassostrea angulata]